MKNNRGAIAISQIGILIVSILAIAFLVGASLPGVSADDSNADGGNKGIVNNFPCSTQSPGASCVPSGTCSGTISPGTCSGGFGTQECCMPSIGGDNKFGLEDLLNLGKKGLGLWGYNQIKKINPITEDNVKNGVKTTIEKIKEPSWFSENIWTGFKSAFSGTTETLTIGSATGILVGAAAAIAIVHYGLEALGSNERNVRGATTAAIVGGSVAATTLGVLLLAEVSIPVVGWIAFGATLVVAGGWIALAYQDYSLERFSYKNSLWQPIPRGENCEQCNDLPFGCSSYQCHTYGEACQLVEVGTENEACVWINPDDIKGPEITPLERALKDDYSYSPLDVHLPEDRGVKVVYDKSQDGCIPAYTSLTLGVNTSEPATCRIDIERKREFSELLEIMDSENNGRDHLFELPHSALISSSAMEALGVELTNGNEYSFFIRCKDANDNPSSMNFIMQFCVDDGPDTIGPEIISTSFVNDVSCIRHDVTSTEIDVYTNEPATCRWDFRNTNYDDMPYEMDCSESHLDYYPAGTLTYGCRGELSGIKDYAETAYFIKCKDQPWLEGKETIQASRNANIKPTVVALKGSKELIIDEITINGKESGAKIKDSTSPVEVSIETTTLGGCEEGASRCYYGYENSIGNLLWSEFYNGGIFEYSYKNNHTSRYNAGSWNVPIRCTDVGGNTATGFANFTIEVDETAPELARAYYEEGYLKLITTEPAECVYTNFDCKYEFKDGSLIQSSNDLDHFVSWDTTTTMYVKCKDSYGNQPAINECSIIVKPHEGNELEE